jgi:hypothetical protein
MRAPAFIVTCLLVGIAAAQTNPSPPAWHKAQTLEFAVATPAGFERRPHASPTTVLHLGREASDEHNRPMRVGMTVERIAGAPAAKMDARAAAEQLLGRFKDDPSFKIIGEPAIEAVTLSDGSPAALLRVEAYRGGDRRTAIGKLVVVKGQLNWVVSGFVTAGRDSNRAGTGGSAYRQVEAHVRTFTLDPNKFAPPAATAVAPPTTSASGPPTTSRSPASTSTAPSTAPTTPAPTTAPSTRPDR